MIERKAYTSLLQDYMEIFPIVSIIGPRQCGKTTLALEYARNHHNIFKHFDLEDPEDFEILKNAKSVLQNAQGLVIIDEIQRMPTMFPYLRVLADTNPSIKLLILGSSSPDLIRYGSESLAGRVGFIEMTPFHLREVPMDDKIFYRGGFPRAYLAASDKASNIWLKQYITTFLEKDVLAMGYSLSPDTMRKVWMMASHYHGNIVNYSEIGRSLNITDLTVKKYLSILESAFMIRNLLPWHENLKKRQVKNPKLYIRDSGILHSLLGIDEKEMRTHPKVGAAWEGFALEAIIQLNKFDKCYFWRTQDGAELDLIAFQGEKRLGFEFKYGDVVRVTPSMRIALNDLNLTNLTVITNGDKEYQIDDQIKVTPLKYYSCA